MTEIKSILCDGGDSGKPFAHGVKALLDEKVTVQVVKRNELDMFDNEVIEHVDEFEIAQIS